MKNFLYRWNPINLLIDDSSIFYKNHRLIYIIKISLIKQNFILYHAYSVTSQAKRERHLCIHKSHLYLFRSDKQLYIYLIKHDIAKCKKINSVMICKQTNLLYQVSATYNCKSELLKLARLESILKECDIRVIKIQSTVF